MYIRSHMQPEPMKYYILKDDESNLDLGRWLVGGTHYEGWYIFNFETEKYEIHPQKELNITWFAPKENPEAWRRYIPRKILDEAFEGHQEKPDFNNCPSINPYL